MMKGPGLELLDGLAHGLSPNTYKDTKSWYKDLSKDTWMKIVDAKNRLKLPEMKDKVRSIIIYYIPWKDKWIHFHLSFISIVLVIIVFKYSI